MPGGYPPMSARARPEVTANVRSMSRRHDMRCVAWTLHNLGADLWSANDPEGTGHENITEEGANFVRLLVENHRLMLLPEIVTQFEARKAETEKRVDATVISAFPLEDAQLKLLSESLKRKFGREVKLTAQTDKSLVGGIVIHAGDVVIDGSVRGRLAELATHLSH